MRALPCLMALAVTAACTPMTAPVVPPAMATHCEAAPATALVRQQANVETGANALALTGARKLRWGPPGGVFTMDFRIDRVNVIYDAAMTITQITCG